MRKKIMALICPLLPLLFFGQTVATSNKLGSSGVTSILSTTSSNYKLSISGAIKQFGTGTNTVGSATLFLHNTTATTGKQYSINSGNDGSFQVIDVNVSNTPRFLINNQGSVGIGTLKPQATLDVNGDVRMVNLKMNNGYNGITANCLSTHIYNSCGTAGYITMGFTANTSANTGNADVFTIQQSNNAIGIRNNKPSEALDVNGNIRTAGFILPTGAAAGRVLTSDANGLASWQPAAGGIGSWTLTGNDLLNKNPGLVLIGGNTNPAPSDATLKLAVNGTGYMKKLRITQAGWADYVFEPGYPLPSLQYVERYIARHHHLEDVPTTAEVNQYGIDVAATQAMLLKKVEELTLYVISLNKKIESLEKAAGNKCR
jgi:hypothetical protein